MSKWAKYYYYLAPLWFALEAFAWPGLRAAPVVGHSTGWVAAFYGVEAAIGAALHAGVPGAQAAALMENVGQLVMTLKMVYFGPIDIAMQIDQPGMENMAEDYRRCMPGALLSIAQLIFALKRRVADLNARLRSTGTPSANP